MVALSAAVQTTGFCAYEFVAKAQSSSVAKTEKFLILEVFAGSMVYPSEFVEGRITKVPNARNDERMSAGDWQLRC